MNGTSWKLGFALFMFAVVSFSALVLSEPRHEVRVSSGYSKYFDKELHQLDEKEGANSRDEYAVLIRAEPSYVQMMMQVALSIIFTAASLFVILAARFGPKDKHWAYATVGTILGFWLHGGLK
jgi:hypothetical protein